MKKNCTIGTFAVFFIYSFLACQKLPGSSAKINNEKQKTTRIEHLINNLKDSKNKEIMVVAHRGDWRNFPENSLQAIQSCIDMGVDMVEIDIAETKDGHLILMHDNSVDRTTNGKGRVKNWTLDSLKTLNLKDGLGVVTPNKIPTLEEALTLCKDKILINLDKSYDIFEKCHEIARKTSTLNQVLIKGEKTKDELESEFGNYLSSTFFMPIIRLQKPRPNDIVEEYLNHKAPVAFEFSVPQDTIAYIKQFESIRRRGSGVWVNALWPGQNGGHDDEKAVLDHKVYDWYINNNVDIIQTDRPQVLLDYLRSKNLHQ